MTINETLNLIINNQPKTLEDILMFSQIMREYTFELDDVCTDESAIKEINQKIAEIVQYANDFIGD